MLVSEIIRKTTTTKQHEDTKAKDSKTNVNSLLQKFSNLSVSIRKSTKQKNAKLEETVKQLEKDLTEYGNEDDIECLAQRIESLLNELEEVTEEREKSKNQMSQRTKNAQDNLSDHIDDLRQMTREIMGGFAKESEKQLFAIELSIKKHQKVFNEQLNHYELGINESLDLLEKEVDREIGEREYRVGEIETEIIGQLEGIEEDIGFEKELREQTEGKLRELIEQLNNDLDEKMMYEKKEREKSNNSLLNLLEQACTKLEKNFSHC